MLARDQRIVETHPALGAAPDEELFAKQRRAEPVHVAPSERRARRPRHRPPSPSASSRACRSPRPRASADPRDRARSPRGSRRTSTRGRRRRASRTIPRIRIQRTIEGEISECGRHLDRSLRQAPDRDDVDTRRLEDAAPSRLFEDLSDSSGQRRLPAVRAPRRSKPRVYQHAATRLHPPHASPSHALPRRGERFTARRSADCRRASPRSARRRGRHRRRRRRRSP